MKYDLDCVRNILLAIESMEYGKEIKISDLSKALPKYSTEELNYNCLKLYEARFIDCLIAKDFSMVVGTVVSIKEITYNGHIFIGNIRNNKIWDKTKAVAKKLGTVSLHMVGSIAKEIFASIVDDIIQ